MRNHLSATRRSHQKTKYKHVVKRNKLIPIALTLIVALVAVATLIGVNSLISNANSDSGNQNIKNYQTKELQIQIQYEGNWKLDYAYSSTTDSYMNGETFTGTGQKTLTITRPPSANYDWAVSVIAQKTDDTLQRMAATNDTLTVSILKIDNTVLDTSSASDLNGTALVTATIND